MKKILIITMIALSCSACSRNVSSVAKTVAYFSLAPYLGPAIVVPELAIEMSREQAEYNRVNGIHHSRDERGLM